MFRRFIVLLCVRLFRHLRGDAFDNFRHAANGIFKRLDRHFHDLGRHALDVSQPPRDERFIGLRLLERGLYLLQLGFLERTSRGRMASPHAYEHLALPMPDNDPRGPQRSFLDANSGK